ncbi:hypothetical protein [Phyllobacterium salinisoli]|uniref:hypothetical protein n=1 Tax=Phyllobacterium salinisoli TaxID=1899321 RepID=UPI00190FAF37|nr:hypothetical protein [Phyllobacterium salinisoli]
MRPRPPRLFAAFQGLDQKKEPWLPPPIPAHTLDSTATKADLEKATTIKTLREAAAAMNCTFVYAFVPVKPLDDILRERAAEKAGQDVTLDHTMRLENQALLKSDLEDERRRLIDAMLAGSPRRLWEDG